MAKGQDETTDSNRSLLNRRGYLQLSGAALASAALMGGAAASQSEEEVDVGADTVVDLGEQGLSNGDTIDDYLDEYFEDGVEVRIPEGEYNWDGRGFHRAANRDAAVIGEGEVILNLQADEFRNDIRAEGGMVAVENLTVRGGPSQSSRFRLEADSDGHVLINNFNWPDGSDEGARSRPYYSPRSHAGVVEIRNCYFKGFSNNGIYTSSPGKGDDGQVIIENCVSHNNNIAGIRIGSSNSIVRNCVILNDSPAPENNKGQLNMRGIRIAESGDDMLIENCEIIHSYDGAGGPIRWSSDGDSSTGHIENVRIYNNTGIAAIGNRESRTQGWSGTNISVDGNGDLGVPSQFENVCEGAGCHNLSSSYDADDAREFIGPQGEEPSEGDEQDAESESESEPQDEEEESLDIGTVGTKDVENIIADTNGEWSNYLARRSGEGTELVIVTDNSGGINYEITTSDRIVPLYEREDYRSNRSRPTDYTRWNLDGTWTAIGSTAGGGHSGDSFVYFGDVVDVDIDGDIEGVTVYKDGSEVSVDALVDVEVNASTNRPLGWRVPEQNKVLIVDGTDAEGSSRFSFSVTGDVTPDVALSSALNSDTLSIDGKTVTGTIANGFTGFRFSGDLVGVEMDGAVQMTTETTNI